MPDETQPEPQESSSEPHDLESIPSTQADIVRLYRASTQIMLGVERATNECMQPMAMMVFATCAKNLRTKAPQQDYDAFNKALIALTLCRSYAILFTTAAMKVLGEISEDDPKVATQVEGVERSIREQLLLLTEGEDDDAPGEPTS